MGKIIAAVLTTVLICALTLAALYILIAATEYVTAIESVPLRTAAVGAEIVLGVVVLLGTVWVGTHLAVRIFGPKSPKPQSTPDGPVN
jgi:hypothetical protein